MTKVLVVSEDKELIEQLKNIEGYNVSVLIEEEQIKSIEFDYLTAIGIFDVSFSLDLIPYTHVDKLIAIGTTEQQKEIKDCIKAGAVDYLIKPVSTELILLRLQAVRNLMWDRRIVPRYTSILKNRATGIIEYAKFLFSQYDDQMDEDQSHCLEVISKNALEITEFVSQMSQLENIRSGSFYPQKRAISVAKITEPLFKQLQHRLSNFKLGNITLNVHIEHSLPFINANEYDAAYILLLILESAVRYSWNKDTELHLSARIYELNPRFVLIDVNYFDSVIKILESADFELKFVQELIEAYKGTLWLEIKEDKTARFCILLPIAEE